MMTDESRWVVDTSCFTHLHRAGHGDLLRLLAPGQLIVIPRDVHKEIENGRETYALIPDVSAVPWAQLTVLSEEEGFTQLQVKAAMGGDLTQHLGECAVIACAYHRGHIAILDEREAVEQALLRKVPTRSTLWIIIEAYKTLFDRDRKRTAQVVDGLLETGMWLPIESGDSLLAWAYEEGLLP